MTTTDKKKPQTKPEGPKGESVPEVYQGELIMGEENEAGTIRISENVIAAVVRKYTLEVEGVIAHTPRRYALVLSRSLIRLALNA